MEELKQRILQDGLVIDNRILKIDNFLNQQIDTTLINHVGQEFARRFKDVHIDRIVTIEASGIAVAYAASLAMGNLPIVFARKKKSLLTKGEQYTAKIYSYTKEEEYTATISKAYRQFQTYMDQLRRDQDSVGAKITVVAEGVMPGLGEPIFDRLDADLAHALMSINAVKGVEIGAGFACVAQRGTEHRDELTPEGFLSNNAGGILGGISSGQPIVAHLALKPTSSITTPGRSIDVDGNPVDVITKGRHDPCVGIRATPIAEAMMAIVLLDHLLRHRAQNADVRVNTPVLGQL